ncbi:MAG: hypothetical protein RL095_482 [Verrucomicrobiota bacterium]|jgi:hypothetical protein
MTRYLILFLLTFSQLLLADDLTATITPPDTSYGPEKTYHFTFDHEERTVNEYYPNYVFGPSVYLTSPPPENPWLVGGNSGPLYEQVGGNHYKLLSDGQFYQLNYVPNPEIYEHTTQPSPYGPPYPDRIIPTIYYRYIQRVESPDSEAYIYGTQNETITRYYKGPIVGNYTCSLEIQHQTNRPVGAGHSIWKFYYESILKKDGTRPDKGNTIFIVFCSEEMTDNVASIYNNAYMTYDETRPKGYLISNDEMIEASALSMSDYEEPPTYNSSTGQYINYSKINLLPQQNFKTWRVRFGLPSNSKLLPGAGPDHQPPVPNYVASVDKNGQTYQFLSSQVLTAQGHPVLDAYNRNNINQMFLHSINSDNTLSTFSVQMSWSDLNNDGKVTSSELTPSVSGDYFAADLDGDGELDQGEVFKFTPVFHEYTDPQEVTHSYIINEYTFPTVDTSFTLPQSASIDSDPHFHPGPGNLTDFRSDFQGAKPPLITEAGTSGGAFGSGLGSSMSSSSTIIDDDTKAAYKQLTDTFFEALSGPYMHQEITNSTAIYSLPLSKINSEFADIPIDFANLGGVDFTNVQMLFRLLLLGFLIISFILIHIKITKWLVD